MGIEIYLIKPDGNEAATIIDIDAETTTNKAGYQSSINLVSHIQIFAKSRGLAIKHKMIRRTIPNNKTRTVPLREIDYMTIFKDCWCGTYNETIFGQAEYTADYERAVLYAITQWPKEVNKRTVIYRRKTPTDVEYDDGANPYAGILQYTVAGYVATDWKRFTGEISSIDLNEDFVNNLKINSMVLEVDYAA